MFRENTVAAPRHPAGRGSAVSPAERVEIQRAYLTEPGATITSLANEFGRTRATIAQLLRGPEYEALKEKIHAELAEQAREVLRKNVVRAASRWAGMAVDRAAARGDHRPMKDLLQATQVIDPDQHTPHVTVQIGAVGDSIQIELGKAVTEALGIQTTSPVPAPPQPAALPPLPSDLQSN